jgi:hypothetical protein
MVGRSPHTNTRLGGFPTYKETVSTVGGFPVRGRENMVGRFPQAREAITGGYAANQQY